MSSNHIIITMFIDFINIIASLFMPIFNQHCPSLLSLTVYSAKHVSISSNIAYVNLTFKQSICQSICQSMMLSIHTTTQNTPTYLFLILPKFIGNSIFCIQLYLYPLPYLHPVHNQQSTIHYLSLSSCIMTPHKVQTFPS